MTILGEYAFNYLNDSKPYLDTTKVCGSHQTHSPNLEERRRITRAMSEQLAVVRVSPGRSLGLGNSVIERRCLWGYNTPPL